MRSFFAALCAILLTASAHAQTPASPQARIEAYLAALSGDPSAFESFAQSGFAPQALAARTPEQRAAMQQRIRADFGALTLTDLDVTGSSATAIVRGATGLVGTFQFEFEGADFRIARAGVQVNMGGNGNEGPSTPPPPIITSMSRDAMDAALTRWIAPMVNADDFAGVVMIAHNGQPFVTRAYGPAIRAPLTPANTETAYNIASIGKRFTKTAIARLIQDGRLSLDTTIGDIIPDYPNATSRTATVRQLIDMQGGIADIFSPARDALPAGSLNANHAYYQFVSTQPELFAPGARNEYCNGCYVVLGEMIARITGERFEDYIQRAVLTPAGMGHTGYFNSNALPTNTARAYMRNAQGAYAIAGEGEGVSGSGAGGVYSTAADLLAFDDALRAGRLLNTEWTSWVVGGEENTNGRNTSALAVQGGSPGVRAELDSNGVWTVIVLSNTHGSLAFDITASLARALGI